MPENTYTYCPDCNKHIPDDQIKWGYYQPEQRHGDNAHPAEYDEPTCPDCGSELTEGAVCSSCDDIFPPEKLYKGVCAGCYAYKYLSEMLSSAGFAIKTGIMLLFNITEEEASDVMHEQLKEIAN